MKMFGSNQVAFTNVNGNEVGFYPKRVVPRVIFVSLVPDERKTSGEGFFYWFQSFHSGKYKQEFCKEERYEVSCSKRYS
ncbi:hypothetical protein U473_03065 [Tepidibacillus decaturensis]|uniref:Uncharacterized protein n=1 Tax=Tepidibacillus decaturensis TaxID=1413211 RepID=A0A135L2C1_9BACI|nr:hypothetical protein U473_03065 [Tepidibacillus decaturensis]